MRRFPKYLIEPAVCLVFMVAVLAATGGILVSALTGSPLA